MSAGHEPQAPAREVVASVAAVVGGLAVVHGWLDSRLAAGVALLAAAWRFADSLRGRTSVPRWGVVLFAGVGLGAITLEGAADGYSAVAVRSLVVLAGLKLLETRSLRDLYTVVYVALFLVGTLFLYRQSIAMALFGLGMVAILTSALVRASSPGGKRSWQRQLSIVAQLLGVALPFAALLFVLFPRLPGPLWQFGAGTTAATTGLGDTMEPGAISRLVLTQDIAFRAAFAGKQPDRSRLYWRGPVLWQTDGRRWRRRDETARPPSGNTSGTPVDYRLILEPHGQKWVPALDLPEAAPHGFSLSADYELATNKPLRTRSNWALRSLTDWDLRQLTPRQRAAGLQLPDRVSGRTRALAQQFGSAATDDAGIVAAIQHHFRTQPFHYSLQPPALGEDPVDEFLFESRTGFCEHYAAAFVVLSRLAGIPARVVTGYQGGEVNPHNQHVVVRQSDAHAWAEVWLAGEGWTRVDPTAAVAPERIDLGLDVAAAVARGGVPVFGTGSDLWRRLARQAGWLADAVEMAWYRNVVNYSDRRRQNLLQDLGIPALGGLATEIALAAGIIGAIGLTGMLALVRPAPRRPEEVRLYDRFCRKLERLGLVRQPAEGPLDFAARLKGRLSADQAALARAITRQYVVLRYGAGGTDRELTLLRDMVRRFRPRSLSDAET